MTLKGTIHYAHEYDGYGKDPGIVECRITYTFHPGTPETGRFGLPENYDQGSGHEVEFDYAERHTGNDVWVRLIDGEWLNEPCRAFLESRDQADLIEGLPNGGERDPDDARDEMIEQRMMEREYSPHRGGEC